MNFPASPMPTGPQQPAYYPAYQPAPAPAMPAAVSHQNPITVNQSNSYGGGNQTVHVNMPTVFGVPLLPGYAPSIEQPIPMGAPSYAPPPSYGGDPYGMPPSYGPPSYGGDPYGMPPSYGSQYPITLPPIQIGAPYQEPYAMPPAYSPPAYEPQDDGYSSFLPMFLSMIFPLLLKLIEKLKDNHDDYPEPLPYPPEEPELPYPVPRPEPPVVEPELPPEPPPPLPPVRPRPGKGPGKSVGDPHITALDGTQFDYHGFNGAKVNYIESNALRLTSKFKDVGNGTTANGSWFANLVEKDGSISKLSYDTDTNKLILEDEAGKKELSKGETVIESNLLDEEDKNILFVIENDGAGKVSVVTPEYGWVSKDTGNFLDFDVFSTTEQLGTQVDGEAFDPGLISATADNRYFKGVVKNGNVATHLKLDLNQDGQIDEKTEIIPIENFLVKGDDPFGAATETRLGKPVDLGKRKFGVNASKEGAST